MSTKEIVEAIAASIEDEVSEASDWTIQKHDRIWKNPREGKVLAVYGLDEGNTALVDNTGGGGFRTTGYHEDFYTLVAEYCEPASGSQTRKLARDEEAELDLYDTAELLRAWADAHQSLPTVGVHRFDWLRTSHAPAQRSELLVRFFTVTFQARKVHAYE